jgi:hypothetical protein
VSAYHEKLTTDYQRLDDRQWATALQAGPAADVPWMKSLVVR